VITFKQVLCPVDLSEASLRPLTYAAAIAGWYDAQLTVLHVVPTFDPMQVHPGGLEAPVRIVYPMPREEVIAELGRALEVAGVDPERPALTAEAGDAGATIVDQAVALRADLLVMGTHGRSGFDRLLLGSVTEEVLRKAPCPVLTVPPHAAGGEPKDVVFKQVLCPVDFSSASLQAVGFALDLARQAKGRVTLLHVIEWLAEHEPQTNVHFNVPEFRRHLSEMAHERLRTLVAEASRTECRVEDVVVAGRAYRQILETARTRNAQLIVMGAQGRGAVGLTLFGSTTQQVVREAECPVLTVRGTDDVLP
jgi:nucleotide-binding universal stress UspA family protein